MPRPRLSLDPIHGGMMPRPIRVLVWWELWFLPRGTGFYQCRVGRSPLCTPQCEEGLRPVLCAPPHKGALRPSTPAYFLA